MVAFLFARFLLAFHASSPQFSGMKFVLISFVLMLPASGYADALCDELWLARNIVFDRAGYCFGSALGKAVFDNGDCTTKSPALDAEGQRVVATVKEEETRWGCKVDTSRRRLDLPNVPGFLLLTTIPIRDGLESACIGYQGPAIPVFSGATRSARVFGQIQPGDTIGYAHISPVEGWSFVQFGPADSNLPQFGWLPEDGYAERCRAYAG